MAAKENLKAGESGCFIIETPSTVFSSTSLCVSYFVIFFLGIFFPKGLSRHRTRDGGKRKVESGRCYY